MKNIVKKSFSVFMAVLFVIGALPLEGIDIDFGAIAELFKVKAVAVAYNTSNTQLEGLYYYRDISGVEDYIEEGTVNGPGVEIIKYIGNEENVVIPTHLGGLPVTVISEFAFCPDPLTEEQKEKNEEYQAKYNKDYYLENTNCASIKSVIIPASVFYISIDAFKNCVALESVEFAGEGIKWIDERAFENTALTEINIPRTLKGLGVRCFNKTQITDIVFGKNDDDYFELWWDAFAGSKVRNVTFKSNGVQVYEYAFTGSYVNTITFEGSVELFEKGAMPINNNPIQEIIFKSSYPAELGRMLVLDYGYNCYYYSDYVSFSKRTPSHSGVMKTDEYSYTVENNYATIVDYFGTSGVVEIPETIGGYVVNKIGSTAFRDFSYYDKIKGETVLLSSVKIPSSVKEIGDYAFANNGYLSSIDFGSSLQKIGASAFAGCSVLYDVALPSTTKEIGDYCFMNTNIKTFSAPGIKKIPASAFENCIKLSTVVLSGNMESIAPYAFVGCSSLRNIVISEGITVIEPYTFQNCTSLTSVTLPTSIKEIGRYAFDKCTSLKTVSNTGLIETLGEYAFSEAPLTRFDFSSVKGEIPDYCFNNGSFYDTTVTIPSTVEKIGENAFGYCDFSNIVISDGVKELGENAFIENSMLLQVSIPGSVEIISDRCFASCPLVSLELNEGIKKIGVAAFTTATFLELTIPESLEEINERAFWYCRIETLNYNAINCEYVITGSSSTVDDETPFCENVYAVNIGNKVESLPDCFLAQTKIQSVTIPESVKTIGEFAFYYCPKLTQVDMAETVQVLNQYCFSYCFKLAEFTVPRDLTAFKSNVLQQCTGIETINYNAVNCKISTTYSSGDLVKLSPFAGLQSLKYFNIGEGVVNIPDSLCAGLGYINQIVLPSTVTDIGKGSFYQCSFDTINLPSGLESIGEYGFACCYNLKTIEFPESLRIINRYAFIRCDDLESVDMKNGVVYLGDDVFNGCASLKTVVLSENINTVPARTFASCRALEEIYIPDNVVRIGENAFQSCKALVKVRMSPNVNYIANEAFESCTSLSEFIWEADSKLIGRLAFGDCTSLKEFNFIGIEKLYENSFQNSGISVLTLGEAKNEEAAKLLEIEAQSFMECDNLEALGIGGNVETIKTQAFANCENLETAVIADSVTSIAPDAFDGCTNLTIFCSENSYAYSYAQAQGIPVSTFVVAPISNQTYTGSRIEPEVKVSLSGESLEENTDFGVKFANNINVGVADVEVKGKGVYKMFASKANFTIVTKNISEVTVEAVADQPYTGEAVTPKINVTDGFRYLTEGKDYTVTYYNNVEEGTATAKVTGKGNYSGFATTSFVISKEAEEPGFFDSLINSIKAFFANIISFFASVFKF